MKIGGSYLSIPIVVVILFSICLVMLCCTSAEHSNYNDTHFSSGVAMGVLDNPKIDEASGLAMSVTNPGMLWTHNDSGDKARIFLIDSLGRYQATVWLEGVNNRDWEDIAVGPGPDATKSYVYIGEIGDNLSRYTYKYIYRIEEPAVPKGKKKLTVQRVDSIKFTLPDGKRDAEALMIDPQTKDLYIFSKREAAVNLYQLAYPQSTTAVMVAERVLTSMPFTSIVAADWSPDGKEILIKNYKQVFYWQRQNHEPVTELLQSPPAILPYGKEPQGESIAFDRAGKGYYTLGEKKKGRMPELMFYKRSNKAKDEQE
jgi:hypothetical protein